MRFLACVTLLMAYALVFTAPAAQGALDGVPDSIQPAGATLPDGSAYFIVEAESVAEIGGDPTTSFLVVDSTNPIQTRTELPNGTPVVKGGLDVLPADTNASGGAAIFDQIGGNRDADTATWEIQFTVPGTYYLYHHTTMYNSDANTTYGNEDSFYLPPALDKNARSDWIGFEGVDWEGDDFGGPGGPQTGDSKEDGWEPTFNNRNVMSAGVFENHNDTGEDYWDGQFHWGFAGYVIDSDENGAYIGDYGMAVQYVVTEDDINQNKTFQISSREPYSAIDMWVFSTSRFLLFDYTQEQMDALLTPVLGDMDLNRQTDFDDIAPFVLGLNDPELYESTFGLPPVVSGDTDGNGRFDFDDIAGFVALLTEGSGQAVVPEPSTVACALSALGIALAGFRRRRRR